MPDTNVWREADDFPASAVRSVSPLTSSTSATADAERVGRDLDEHRRGTLADVDRAAEQDGAAIARARQARSSTGWRSRCCRSRTTSPRCRRRAGSRPAPPASLCALASSRSRRQCGRSASRQAASPALAVSTWPVAVASPARMALREPKLQAVLPEAVGQLVQERLVGDRRLGHAEAAERARGRVVRVDGAARRAARRPRRTGPSRERARGWRPSGPTRRSRRCRSRRGSGTP